MDNKGFTLVEMLAVVVILAIISGIAVNGVISYINTSKKKSELVFVKKLDDYIDSYVGLFKGKMAIKEGETYFFDKCKRIDRDDDSVCLNDEKTTVEAIELEGFNLLDITKGDVKLVDEGELINPANKNKCFLGVDPIVRVFKDTDFVYYYYVDLRGNNTSCEISDENAIVTNIPKRLCNSIKVKDNTIDCES